MRNRREGSLLAAAFAVLGIAAYGLLLRAGFIWDDVDEIFVTPAAGSFAALKRIWLEPSLVGQYYPVTYTSIWLERRLWGELNPASLHFTNIVLQLVNAALVGLLLKRLKVPFAWAAAAIFAVHPIEVETVGWINERKNLLSLFFSLISLRFCLELVLKDGTAKGKRVRAYFAAAFMTFVLAVLSKTVVCTLPCVALVIAWWKNEGLKKRDWASMSPLIAAGVVIGLATAYFERVYVGASGTGFSLGILERLTVAGGALWFYVGKLLWPHPLIFIYPRWDVSGAGLSGLLPGVAWLGLLIALARARKRGALAALLIYSGVIFPALGFFALYPMRYSFVADHFQYSAGIPLIALGAAAAGQGLSRTGDRRASWAALVLVLVAFTGLSRERTRDYESLEMLWRDTLAGNPSAWIAANNLGVVLARQGKLEEAETLFTRALDLNPDDVESLTNLSLIFLNRSEPRAAEPLLRRAVRLKPSKGLAHLLLARSLEGDSKKEARSEYQEALRLMPDSEQARTGLARVSQ